MVKNPPANAGEARDFLQVCIFAFCILQVCNLASLILAWKIPGTDEPCGYSS